MKRVLSLLAIAAFLAVIPVSHHVFGKGHVPAHKQQVCHGGKVLTISKNALNTHLDHGDCRINKAHLPALFSGDACDESDCENSR